MFPKLSAVCQRSFLLGAAAPTLSAAPVSCPKAGALPWKKTSCLPKILVEAALRRVTFQLPGRPTQMTRLRTARKINKNNSTVDCWCPQKCHLHHDLGRFLCEQEFFKTQVRVDEWWKSTMIHWWHRPVWLLPETKSPYLAPHKTAMETLAEEGKSYGMWVLDVLLCMLKLFCVENKRGNFCMANLLIKIHPFLPISLCQTEQIVLPFQVSAFLTKCIKVHQHVLRSTDKRLVWPSHWFSLIYHAHKAKKHQKPSPHSHLCQIRLDGVGE